MFEHLDDPNPPQAGPDARAAVSARVASRHRRRQIRWITGVAVVVIVGLAIGLPLGLRSGNNGVTHPAGRHPVLQGPPSSTAPSEGAAVPSHFSSVVDLGFGGNGGGWVLGRTRAGQLELAATADGGKTWQRASLAAEVASSSGFARPDGTMLLFSTEHAYESHDGGDTFMPMSGIGGGFVDSPRTPPSISALRSSCPVSSPSCRPVLSVSDDGGRTWQTPDAQPVMGNRDGQMVHPSHNVTWVVSLDTSDAHREPVVSRTTDGGTTWTSTAGNTTVPECLDLHIVGASTDWLQLLCNRADGSGWKLLTTADAGHTWALSPVVTVPRTTPSAPGEASVGVAPSNQAPLYRCAAPAHCWLVLPGPGGAPYVWRTTDGGKTWASSPLP